VIQGGEWEFGGTVEDTGAETPVGFQRPAAQVATQSEGFYIFKVARA
jgi:hypothetical protein